MSSLALGAPLSDESATLVACLWTHILALLESVPVLPMMLLFEIISTLSTLDLVHYISESSDLSSCGPIATY